MAPPAAKGASFHKYCRPDARAVVKGKPLNVKYQPVVGHLKIAASGYS
jgi:hypothetical protein